VGTSGDYAPFSLMANSGRYVGLDIDISEALARDLGFEIRFVPFAWPALTERLASGEFDVVVSGVTMRPERALVGRYTRPYAISGAVACALGRGRRPNCSPRSPSVRLVVNRGHLEQVARSRFPRALIGRSTTIAPCPPRARRIRCCSHDSAEVRDYSSRAAVRSVHARLAILYRQTVSWRSGSTPGSISAERDDWLRQLRARWGARPQRSGRRAAGAIAPSSFAFDLMPAVAAAKRTAAADCRSDQEARVLTRSCTGSPTPRRWSTIRSSVKSPSRCKTAKHQLRRLAALRAAIARIDEQLIAEMNRPLSGTPPEWQAVSLERWIDQC
jgi:hypothetical protein